MLIPTILLTNAVLFMMCLLSLWMADHQQLLKACMIVKVDLQSEPMY